VALRATAADTRAADVGGASGWWAVALIGMLIALMASGCQRVAVTTPSQLARLSHHRPGKPPVKIRTVGGDLVEIEGDYTEVRVRLRGRLEADDELVRLRPPFRAAKHENGLLYQLPGQPPAALDLSRVERVEIVQIDGGRTQTVVFVMISAAVVGFLGGMILDAQRSSTSGDNNCAFCEAPIGGALLFGGISAAIVVPLTKYY
jgi:hypothetical protein